MPDRVHKLQDMYLYLNRKLSKDDAAAKEERVKYQRQIASYIDGIARVLGVRKILKGI